MTQIDFAEAFMGLFQKVRYKNLYGGRGGAKSHAVAEYLVLRALEKPTKILCTREYMNSISDSVHQLLDDKINKNKFGQFFEVKKNEIVARNGSKFIFKGLAKSIQSIKSIEGIDICWVEEAQTISQFSLDVLIPTIRKPDSEIIFTWNPENEEDPIYQMTVANKPKNCWSKFVNYKDNPWFPNVLEAERLECMRVDPDKYAWVWEGQLRQVSDAQIFKGKIQVREISPRPDESLMHGLDFGFANDPNAFTRCWVRHEDGKKYLMVDYAMYSRGIGFDSYIPWISHIKGFRPQDIKLGMTDVYKVWADAARPETISHLYNSGLNCEAAEKWPGSVEDGITWLRSFDGIVFHPRCVDGIKEGRLYCYVIDKKTGLPTAKVADAHNHIFDSIRYACWQLIKASTQTGSILDIGDDWK